MSKGKRPSGEGNKYDKIIKENLQSLVPALLHRVMKLEDIRLENLPQIKLQTTIEREPDYLKKMFSAKYPEGCILQIEFEGKDDRQTDYRMHEYGAILVRKYRLPLEQHVIYLLEGVPKNINGEVNFEQIYCRFKVHCLYNFSYREFIDSAYPEEAILSILANPEDEPP